ncbi:MAG: protease modulator HflC [Gammaproteobacteria bacterium]|nr:MAG: protease modulator HflC [Gammaproteobacteria bacterium]
MSHDHVHEHSHSHCDEHDHHEHSHNHDHQHSHGHSHSHHGHHHGHHHHGHSHGGGTAGPFPWLRVGLAALLIAVALTAAVLVQVRTGEAAVVTRFGNPVRVILEPGLATRWPAPFESIIPVDLRLRTTSSGLQDVGTRDGLRIIVQAYVAWQVQADAQHVQRFMRAVQNKPDETARQIRTLVGSALETTAASYDLSNLINTNASKVLIADFETRLTDQINRQLLDIYGVKVVQVGIERLTLPSVTLSATVDRMRAERETIAIERTAIGKRQAADIRSAAERDARIIQADALAQAADIEAQSRVQAAALYGKSFTGSPELYRLLRSLDTLGTLINPQTRLILRTDAAPFRALVEAPGDIANTAAKAATTGTR